MSGTAVDHCLYFGATKGWVVFDKLLLADARSRQQRQAWKWDVTSDGEVLVIVLQRVQADCKEGSAC